LRVGDSREIACLFAFILSATKYLDLFFNEYGTWREKRKGGKKISTLTGLFNHPKAKVARWGVLHVVNWTWRSGHAYAYGIMISQRLYQR